MRNETMRERFDGILTPKGLESADVLAARSNDEILATVGAMRRKQSKVIRKPGFPEANLGRRGKKPGLEATLPPRYVPPPRLANPFSVHAHSIAVVPPPPEAARPVLVPAPAASEDKSKTVLPIRPEIVPSDVQRVAKDEESIIRQSNESAAAEIAPAQSADRQTPIHPLPEPDKLQRDSSQESVPILIQGSGEGEELKSIEDAPIITLPPNLAWLEKPTPFSNNLSAIAESLRAARQRVIFTLGQHQARAAEFKAQWDAEVHGAEVQRGYLRALDDTLSACALVAEQSAGLEPRLLTAGGPHHKADHERTKRIYTSARWDRTNPNYCREEDVIKFFAANPKTNWKAAEVCANLPPAKQAHARKNMPVTLASMARAGKIQRVGFGIYRAIGS